MHNIINKKIIFILASLFLLISADLIHASEFTGSIGNIGTVVIIPTASPVADTYSSAQSVALTALGASSIRYTVDGTTPTCTSTVYSTNISVLRTQTIKALSCYAENNHSDVASFIYNLSIIDGSNQDIELTSATSGEADLSSGAVSILLSSSTAIDVSSSTNAVSGGHVTVGGVDETVSDFPISGQISGVDLTTAQSIGDQSVLVGEAVALESGVDDETFSITDSDFANIRLYIPDHIKVLAPSGWNKKIIGPRAGSSSGTSPSSFTVGNTVFGIGSTNSIFLFDKPVSVVITGVSGNFAYKPVGSSVWTKITNTCAGTYDSPTAPTFPGECYISSSGNTKIYTYHLTTFGSLNVVNNSASVSLGGGGGGGGSMPVPTDVSVSINSGATIANTRNVNLNLVTTGASFMMVSNLPDFSDVSSWEAVANSKPWVLTAGNGIKTVYVKFRNPSGYESSPVFASITLKTGAVIPTSKTPVAQTSTGDQDNYVFTIPTALGSRGPEVTALQERLTAEGVYSGEITGYFGLQTQAAVKRFQAKYGIEQLGAVGPATRAKLNISATSGTTTPVSTPSSYASTSQFPSNLSNMTLKELIQLLLQIGAIATDKIETAQKIVDSL